MIDTYNVQYNSNFEEFAFTSEGQKGSIDKLVLYEETDIADVYNLAFGDYSPITGKIDDQVVTNNGDRKRVLSTVAATLPVFLEKHPSATVIFHGSTDTRTKLYQRGISSNLKLAGEQFIVLGFTHNGWELFEENKDYLRFIVRLKL